MQRVPRYGVGVSYRPRWHREILDLPGRIDCLEVIAEHYLDAPGEKLRELAELGAEYPLLPHGIGLSFGTDAPLDEALLRKTARLVEELQPPWFSEHVAFTGAAGWQIGHLSPLPFTREAVDTVCRNVQRWNQAVGVPLLLENISYLVALPGELSEAQFLTEIVERSDCGLLLDLHNAYANAVNHRYDVYEFLAALPLERVGQIHLGGGHDEEGYRIDSHSAPSPDPVWELLRFVAGLSEAGAVVVEWDAHLPPFSEILREVETAKAILRDARDGSH